MGEPLFLDSTFSSKLPQQLNISLTTLSIYGPGQSSSCLIFR